MRPADEIAPLADVPIAIEALLDRKTMSVAGMLSLEVGRVVWLARSAGDNLDIYAGGALLAYGEAVVIENAMGMRITDFAGGGEK